MKMKRDNESRKKEGWRGRSEVEAKQGGGKGRKERERGAMEGRRRDGGEGVR